MKNIIIIPGTHVDRAKKKKTTSLLSPGVCVPIIWPSLHTSMYNKEPRKSESREQRQYRMQEGASFSRCFQRQTEEERVTSSQSHKYTSF